MQPDAYVAPARYLLTVLHRQDPGAGPGADGAGEPTIGCTLCGLLMGEDELWVPVERREGDVVCWVCEAEGAAPGWAGGVQGALL